MSSAFKTPPQAKTKKKEEDALTKLRKGLTPAERNTIQRNGVQRRLLNQTLQFKRDAVALVTASTAWDMAPNAPADVQSARHNIRALKDSHAQLTGQYQDLKALSEQIKTAQPLLTAAVTYEINLVKRALIPVSKKIQERARLQGEHVVKFILKQLREFEARLKKSESTIAGMVDPSTQQLATKQVQELEQLKRQDLDGITKEVEKFAKDHPKAGQEVTNKIKDVQAALKTIDDLWKKKHNLASRRQTEFHHVDQMQLYRQWLKDAPRPLPVPQRLSETGILQRLREADEIDARVQQDGQQLRAAHEEILAEKTKQSSKPRRVRPSPSPQAARATPPAGAAASPASPAPSAAATPSPAAARRGPTRRAAQPREFRCKVCNTVCSTQSNLTKHMRKQHEMMRCGWPKCMFYYQSDAEIDAHEADKH